ncbi:2-methylcitrate synthase/citrate synthase II [compost metagenome]
MCFWYRSSHDGVRIDCSSNEDSIGRHFLHLLHGKQPTELHVKVMNVSLILCAEHEFNASTFTARVCALTLSDMYSCATAAIGITPSYQMAVLAAAPSSSADCPGARPASASDDDASDGGHSGSNVRRVLSRWLLHHQQRSSTYPDLGISGLGLAAGIGQLLGGGQAQALAFVEAFLGQAG